VRAAGFVPRSSNLERCTAAIAIVKREQDTWADFDAGRAAQNMMLAAWNEGVGSCPNAFSDREALSELLGVETGEEVAILLSFGYPPAGTDPESRSLEQWLADADREPLSNLVSEV
jgi:nitroreductase